MQAPARHKKWTRSSQSCTQTETRSARVTSSTAGTVALSELVTAAHGAPAHALTQQQQYSKRSRYCLQLTSCGAGPEHAKTAYNSSHSTREAARRGATSPAVAVAAQRASIPSVPAKYAVPAPAVSARVYVRGTTHAQQRQQHTQMLQASLPGQRHAAINARAVSAASPAGVAVQGSAVGAATTGDVQFTHPQGTLLATVMHVQAPQQHHQHKAEHHTSEAIVQQAQQPLSAQQQQAKKCCGIHQMPQGQLQQRPLAKFVHASPAQQHAQAASHQLPAVAAPAPQLQAHQAAKQQSLVRQPPQQRQQRQPVIKHWLAGAGQVITCAAASGNVKLLYKKHRHKLERTGVRAAVAGASLSWIRESAAPHLAAAAQASVAAAAASAAAKRAARNERLKQAQQRQQQRHHQLLQSRRQAAAGSVPRAAAGMHKMPAKWLTPGFKLVRIGGQLYYSTPKGLCSAAAAKLMAKRTPTHSRAAQHILPGTGAASGLGVQKIIQKARSSSSSSSGMLASQQRPAIPAAAGVAKRLLSSTAVARSLAVARGRNAAKRAAASRGICRHYCKHGKCDLALRGRCEKVHDPSKVAVCQPWLVGKCSNADCKLQHKVVPELMPVCTYFLEGLCSNRDCPYLHVKVAADAPACRAFLQGYCPAGATCPHKHLTHRMVKQQQQQQQQHPRQQQQQQERDVDPKKKHLGAKARNRYVRRAAAAAEARGDDSRGVTGKQQQGFVGGAGAAAAGGGGCSRSAEVIESRCSVGMVLEQLLPQPEGE